MAIITTPGIHPNITPAQYFAECCPAPAATNSILGIILNDCPAKAAHAHPAIKMPDVDLQRMIAKYKGSSEYPDKHDADAMKSNAQRLGSVVHRLALGKGQDYALSPHDEYRSGEAKQWKADCIAQGMIPLKKKELDQAQQMAGVIEAAIEEAAEGHEYDTEVVLAWQENDLWCRAMMDVFVPALNLALDVKTCASANDQYIDRAFNTWGYSRQSVWYQGGLDSLTGKPGEARFRFLFVENEEPHLGRTANISEGMATGARMELDAAFAKWSECLNAGEWPGYGHKVVMPTAWKVREWAEMGMEVEG